MATGTVRIARQLGKSKLQDIMVRKLSQELSDSIDRDILEERSWSGPFEKYQVNKSWNDRRGRKMHRISATYEIRNWLEEEHSQYGINNPEWWKYGGQINITDKLYMLLVMRWA
jgi:hypothetical protein